MAERTKIQWATHTFNPWRGCQKIAPGCANCYADRQSKRNTAVLGIWGSEASGATRVVASEDQWVKPRKWNGDADRHPNFLQDPPPPRPRVFCASLADVFEDWAGPMVNSQGGLLVVDGGRWLPTCTGDTSRPLTMDDVRSRLFSLIDATPNLDWLLLTKRPENVRRLIEPVSPLRHVSRRKLEHNRSNVWLGVSCSTQDDADRLIPELLKCRGMAAKLFVSLEPLIEPVDLDSCWPGGLAKGSGPYVLGIDWVIVGGESGTNARPYNVEWARTVIQQCKNAGVACFHKQLGSAPLLDIYGPDHEGLSPRFRLGGLNDPKGGDMDEWPEDLRVREVPND